jgi:phosphoribosylglycinamide formyltransferase-1
LKQAGTAPRAAILISGSGSNLQAFIDSRLQLPFELAVVLSNKASAFGLERAQQADIPTHHVDHSAFSTRENFDQAMLEILQRHRPDIIILAGFMRILSATFVRQYPGRILNIHPALLPAYPGLNTHQRALDANEPWHGCTVHFVTEELDAGPAILQGRVPVLDTDDANSLSARVQTMEHIIFPQAATWLASGRIEFTGKQVFMDGKPLLQPIVYDWQEKTG